MSADMTTADIDRYINWCRQYGVTEAQRMMKEIEKNKKNMKKILEKKDKK